MADRAQAEYDQRIRAVLNTPSFLAFSGICGSRIQTGNSLMVFGALLSLGCPNDIANQIIEGWPDEADVRADRLRLYGMPLALYAALRLSCFFANPVDTYPWPAIMARLLRKHEDPR